KLRHVSDAREKYALLGRLAELGLGRNNDKSKAVAYLTERFQLFPEDEQARVDLENAARLSGAWDGVVSAYVGAIKKVAEPTSLRLRIGRVLLEELKRPQEALGQYDAVLAQDPANEAALAALESIYRAEGRSSEL